MDASRIRSLLPTIISLIAVSPASVSGQDRQVKVGLPRLVVGPEIRLGGDANRSQWEVCLVVSRKDPKRLLVSCIVDPPRNLARLFRPKDGYGSQTVMVFQSADGGTSWESHEFPREDLWDPVVAFARDGSAYIVYMHGVHRSDDNGRTWGPRLRLSDTEENIDHPMLAIDNTDREFAGRVYVGGYTSRDGVLVYSSDDGGRTFQRVAALPDWDNLDAYVHNLLVLSDGTLFVPLAQIDHTRGRFHKRVEFSSIISTDGGVSFSQPRKMAGPLETFPSGNSGVSNVVCAAGHYVDKERIYALWSERQNGHARMRLIFSDDAGQTWSKPKLIAGELPPGEHGACNVAVSGDGTVGVSWINHGGEGGYDAWFTASVDGGATFLPPARLSRETSRVLSGQVRPYPGDDYLLMDAGPSGTFHAIWPDARTGRAYQIYTCKVELHR